MRFYKDSGYGQMQVSGLPFLGSGKVFIVGDSSTANIGILKELFTTDPDGDPRFFSTIDSAVAACTANAGDVIIVMPGHTETVTAAGGLDLDIAGITILGLGNGNDRPLINLTTATTADIDIDAANITIENVIIDLTGIDAVAAGIDVNANDFTLRNCRVIIGDSDGQAVVGVLSDTNIDRVTVENCDFLGDTIAGPEAAIRLIGGVEHKIRHNNIQGSFSEAPLSLVTTAPLRVLIEHNVLINVVAAGTAAIQGVASMTGVVRFNSMAHRTDDLGGWINTPGSVDSYENYGTNAVGETAILDITGGASTT